MEKTFLSYSNKTICRKKILFPVIRLVVFLLAILPYKTLLAQCPPGTTTTGSNLVVNGDFSLGDTGFNSNYIYGTGGTFGLLSTEGEYAIVNDPNAAHFNFASFGDHTTGTGLMMVINGASNANVNVWCQTIAVDPNTTYLFSTWIATAFSSNPAVLQFSVNGNNLGNSFTAPSTTGIWQQFSTTWFSGTNTTATICIVNQNTDIFGNDFAIDDITFLKCNCSLNLIASGDTTICNSEQANLLATGASDYQWLPITGLNNNTVANPIANPQQTTTYTVTGTQNGCSGLDTVTITVESIVADAGPDTLICIGDTIALNATGGVDYLWTPPINLSNPNAAFTFAYPDQNTTYVVSVSNNNCVAYDSVNLIISSPPQVYAGIDTAVFAGSAYRLSGNPGGGTWATSQQTLCTGCTFFDIQVMEPGTYYYYFKEQNGCDGIDSVFININGNCSKPIFPNAFTPNSDGNNDYFQPIIIEGNTSELIEWSIYNRWGTRIFSSSSFIDMWDGNFNDVAQPIGVFAYICKYICEGEEKIVKGNITLLR